MKITAALFALFTFPTFVTSIPLLDGVNDGYVDKRQLSHAMSDIVNAINVFADEFSFDRGYNRSEFTKNIVQSLYKKNHHFNYIICHPDHDYDFGSPWGVNVYDAWVTYHRGTEYGTKPGYDIVIGKNGTFTRYGDGGFINWAYIGNIISSTDFGHKVVVTFGVPD